MDQARYTYLTPWPVPQCYSVLLCGSHAVTSRALVEVVHHHFSKASVVEVRHHFAKALAVEVLRRLP